MPENATPDVSADKRWGFSPISRRYVLRKGGVWKRLVKSGVVNDPEVADQLANPITGTRPRERPPNNIHVAEGAPETHVTRAETVDARKAAKKLIADHVDELEGLPPDQVDALLRRLLAIRMGKPEPAAARESAARPVVPHRAPKKAPPPSRRVRVAELFSTEADTCEDTTEPPTSDYSD
jgi:hypothetical protein